MDSTSLRFKRIFYPGFNIGTRCRKKICRLFLREPDIRTLDCGCGNGYFTSRAVKAGGTALGVSFDPGQIARCNEFKPLMGVDQGKLEFRVTNAREIDEMAERFDQILLLEVIEHIDDDATVLKKLAGLLKPSGVLHLTTPASEYGPLTGTLDRFERGGHVRLGYTEERLTEMFRTAGLDIVYRTRVGGLGMRLTPIQERLIKLFGNSLKAQAVAFAIVYPFFLLLELIPVPRPQRLVQHFIGRKSAAPAAPRE